MTRVLSRNNVETIHPSMYLYPPVHGNNYSFSLRELMFGLEVRWWIHLVTWAGLVGFCV
jgi:hypothetical protein